MKHILVSIFWILFLSPVSVFTQELNQDPEFRKFRFALTPGYAGPSLNLQITSRQETGTYPWYSIVENEWRKKIIGSGLDFRAEFNFLICNYEFKPYC